MTPGATAQFVFRNAALVQVLKAYERALADSGFELRQRRPSGPAGFLHKAVWGSRGEAYLVGSFVPFGKLLKSGKRLGAEAQIYPAGADVVLRLAVVPYMELFDSPEILLLTQGVFEKITDDEFSREKLDEIARRVWDLGYRWS